MTKADIVTEISKRTGIDRPVVATTLDAFMDCVKRAAANKQNVYLRGFGSFVQKMRAQKTARNISKNTTLIVPAHSITIFRPAKSFNPKPEVIEE